MCQQIFRLKDEVPENGHARRATAQNHSQEPIPNHGLELFETGTTSIPD
jgi:hypothetical protein